MFRAVRATAQRISILTVASVVALSSLTVLAPLFISQSVAAAGTTHITSETSWSSRSRNGGSATIVAGGLKLTTIDNSSKAAVDLATNFDLDDVVAPSITWGGVVNQKAGINLAVDVDNNGSFDGYLVLEESAGIAPNWWLAESTTAARASAPYDASQPSYRQYFGSADQWKSAFPDAKVLSVGVSLGSGAGASENIIKKITTGGADYTFALPDTLAPSVYIKGNANTYTPYSTGSFTHGVYRTANFKLNDNKSLASWQINGGALRTASGPWSDANNIAVGVNGGVQGANTITVRDVAGNSTTLPFILDNTGPTITVKPESLGSTSANIFRNVSFKLHDANKVDYLTLNGVMKDLTDNTNSDLNSVGLHNWFGEREGVNELVVYDVVGNSTTLVFTLDRVAPTGTFAYSHNNQVTNQDVTVTLTTDEPVATPTGWTKTNDTTFTKLFTDNAKFTTEITDLAGNTRTLSGEVKRIDHVNPVFINVADGGFYGSPVQVIAHDQSLKDKLIVNGTPVQLTNTPGTWDWATVAPLSSDGVYELIATDKGGNSTTITITIDTTAPTSFNLLTPADGANLTSSSFAFDWEDAADATSVTYSILLYKDGEWVPSASDLTDSEWTPASPLEEGSYGWRVWATDAAGNETWTDGWTFVIDNIVPNPDGDNGQGGGEDEPEVVTTNTPPTGNEAGFVASRATTNDGSRTLAANTTSQTDGAVQAAETTNEDGTVDGAVDEDEQKPAEDAGSVFDYWWIVLLALIGLFWLFAARRRKNDEN